MEKVLIPVYFLKLSPNIDKLNDCLKQFEGKPEFEINIITEEKRKKGEKRLWSVIRKAVQTAMNKEEDLCIICKEDHSFSENYEFNKFLKDILEAHRLEANYLLCGIDRECSNILILPSGLCWIDSFHESQFIVIYNSFYESILRESFFEFDKVDEKLSKMTSNKLLVYPFISRKETVEDRKEQIIKTKAAYSIAKAKDIEKRIKILVEKIFLYKNIP